MGFATLLREELRSLPRGRFTLLAVALLLAYVAVLGATAGTMPHGDGYFLLPALGLIPTLLIPIAAVSVARARGSRFLEGVFTAPVTATEFILVKFVAALLLGLAYVAAVLPLLLVKWAHLGIAPADQSYLLLGAGMALYAAAIGTLLGVLFTSRGSLAAFTVGVVVMVGAAGAMLALGNVRLPVEEPARTLTLRILHLSGGVLLHDALGLGTTVRSFSPAPSAAGFALLCGGALLAAWWIFSRRQSPETWEVRGPGAAAVAAVVALVLVVPSAVGGVEYGAARETPDDASRSTAGVWVRIVPRGGDAPPPKDSFNRPPEVVPAGRPSDVDLLLFLHDAQGAVRDVTVRLAGDKLGVEPATVHVEDPVTLPKARPHRFTAEQPYLRIPAVLTPSAPESLRGNEHALLVNVTYEDESPDARGFGEGAFKVESEVPHATLQVALAGAPAPLAALAAFALRRWRMR